MRFNRWRRTTVAYLLVACVLGITLIVAGCSENKTEEHDVFVEAQDRVSNNVLPEIADESQDVLRNLTNLLTALPQICATPMATFGSFTSALPALGPPQSVVLLGKDEEDQEDRIFRGSWNMVWNDVVLGSDGISRGDASPVNITLNVRPRTSGQGTLQAVPFTLIPQSALLATATAGQPTAPAAPESYFLLYQDTVTGVWTLRWKTLETPLVFDGKISGTPLTRVIRRVSAKPGDIVKSLEVGSGGSLVRFQETTEPGDEKGFTFFARPGELVEFELRIGPDDNDLEQITADQLYIGSDNAQLPSSEDPGDFKLATNLPFDPTNLTGEPMFTPGAEVGMFIWQDVEQNTCDAGEDRWRVIFTTDSEQTEFKGTITALEDDNHAELTFVTIGACQEGNRKDGGKTLDYNCTLAGDQTGGYDICVTAGRRVSFDPEVNDNELPDPGVVFIGTERQPPPSPDPFSIVFDIDLEEINSARDLTLSDAQLVLSGNSDVDGVLRLNPDQVSLDPLCGRLPEDVEAIVRPVVAATFAPDKLLVQPAVTLTGDGDYSTSRYDGSVYSLNAVEFLNPALKTLANLTRFLDDRGEIELKTRVQDELENTTITGEVDDITANEASQATWPVEINISLNRVLFKYYYDINDPKSCPPPASDPDGESPCIVDLTVE